MTTEIPPSVVGQPVLRWSGRARSIPEIETELARIWAEQDLTTEMEGEAGRRHIAARTNVMNLVVIARRPEVAELCAASVQALTGRHPSRTIVVQAADADGPSWLDARVEAHCVLPREDAPETCAETIHVTAGGDAGRHLSAIVAPLLIHDLPVTIWWPNEPTFGTRAAADLFALGDRIVVDGSSWSGDGLGRLRAMATLTKDTGVAVSDFALLRQSRWREAIASIFDDPEFLPYLHSIKRIAVTYATHDGSATASATNVIKPTYHVAWLASRLGMTVKHPLDEVGGTATSTTRSHSTSGMRPVVGRGMTATLAEGRSEVAVAIRPVVSDLPSGTTLRVELLASRRGSELRADVTAEAESVDVRVWQDGIDVLSRRFQASRRNDIELLAEAIETGHRDVVSAGALQAAAQLSGDR
jgi:glucose-6-phosphate dehydrogenase assembly protein OpcA